MFDPNADVAPVNPLPQVVVLLAVLIGAPEIVFQLGEAGILGGAAGGTWRVMIAEQFGFLNRVVFWMWETGNYPMEALIRFVSYMFVHASFASTLFSVVFVLALGKFVGERVSGISVIVIFLGSGIVAAGVQAVAMGPNLAMLGAGAACFGLIGALSWILFSEQRAVGQNGLRAFQLIGALAVLLGVFAVLFGGSDWFERLIGFAAGFALCAMLRPVDGEDIRYWGEWFKGRSN